MFKLFELFKNLLSRKQSLENLDAPRVIGALPPMPGGEENLLPKDAWLEPLRVEFNLWPDYAQAPEVFDTLELIWDNDESNPVATKQYQGPIDPDNPPDLWLHVPIANLQEGVHQLRYRVLPWNGSPPRDSVPVNVTIDKTPPILATASELSIPDDIRPPNKLTARYLELNDDEVKAGLPSYTSPRPWDRITWYWGPTPGTQEEGGEIELDDSDYSEPVIITIPGDLIRERDDGWRYVWYKVRDRAGNVSHRSEPVELDVAATPIPRDLPWPSVEKASGEGARQTLDPLQVTTGAVVVIPEGAAYPSEEVWLQWGEPDSLGACRVDSPIDPGQRRYLVPKESVAPFIDKEVPVYYVVVDHNSEQLPSQRLTLKIIKLSGLPTVQCDGLTGGDLSYRNVEATGAKMTLIPWPLMSTDHWIRITMTGLNSGSGVPISYPVINGRAVTAREVLVGIGGDQVIRVPKTFLNTLRRNAPLTGRVYVSFDGGKTWPPDSSPDFPLLTLTLVD
ncbi:hypothetical protein [Pseudomonas sp. QTF5]|uniref:hypothetical protein n=1 Tax=Pseudomonas sp. QTF5 TaxID=1435425 RepID=UPI002114A730|nr:hypothetical protein [Pseudomonas sp. QTF5]